MTFTQSGLLSAQTICSWTGLLKPALSKCEFYDDNEALKKYEILLKLLESDKKKKEWKNKKEEGKLSF